MSKLDDKAAFQDKLYENIEPNTSNAIIAATHRPNRAMHDIITSFNSLPIIVLIMNDTDDYIITFKDTCGGCE